MPAGDNPEPAHTVSVRIPGTRRIDLSGRSMRPDNSRRNRSRAIAQANRRIQGVRTNP
jgi:hypothetical protein